MLIRIDFKENSDVRFYIDSADAGNSKHTGKKPVGNNGSLYIGQSYIANQQRTQFQGTISEIRIWNVARPVADVNTNLIGSESGLTAWWRFEENTGNIAYDAKGGNHARISGAQWVKNPDPKGSSFVIYRDGKEAAKVNITRPAMGDNQFTVGARKQSSYREHFILLQWQQLIKKNHTNFIIVTICNPNKKRNIVSRKKYIFLNESIKKESPCKNSRLKLKIIVLEVVMVGFVFDC